VRDIAPRRREPGLPVAGQVTSLELFFDLVFVFTITQLTATVQPGGWAVTGRVGLLLLVLWWMYGGYAWLTNAAPPVTPRRRILLVLGMVGLFVTAMAIPHAYGSDRVVFASGYLVVVAVHAAMYVSEAARITRGMVVQLLGWNMVGALLGLVGALFFEDILVWWWLAAFVVAVVLPRLVPVTALDRPEDDGGPSFELVAGHFVERHGLMLLIALGESVLAIGIGLGTGGGSTSTASRSRRSASCWRRRCTGRTSGPVRTPAPRLCSTVCRPIARRQPRSRPTATPSGWSSSGSC
jgi:low temperature requirement protein LtrA